MTDALGGLSTCREAKLYLIKKGVRYPELWERYNAPEFHTPNGLVWKWLGLHEKIHGRHLEYVNHNSREGDYIVVLKCEDQIELPQPIGLSLPCSMNI